MPQNDRNIVFAGCAGYGFSDDTDNVMTLGYIVEVCRNALKKAWIEVLYNSSYKENMPCYLLMLMISDFLVQTSEQGRSAVTHRTFSMSVFGYSPDCRDV